jgi:hypothetical protein
MKNTLVLIILLLSPVAAWRAGSAAAQAPPGQPRVRLIDFYGYGGLDLDKVRAAMPAHEGETLPSYEVLEELRGRIKEAVRRVTGRPATEVSFVSPGRDDFLIYVGLSGDSVKNFPYNPAPKGSARLSAGALEVFRQVDEAFDRAMQRGASGEDDTKGYMLSSNDPELRAKQLAMHEYAARHEGEIRRVLRESADASQRRMAAQMLGYVNQSARQIADLVRASHDPDEDVRNNATRALGALARSDPKVAARIPAEGFVEMLSSGIWSDRNKAGGLLLALSQWRAPKLLAELRAHALDSLIEMARWRDGGHANPARMMLGRMAGMEEERLQKLAFDNGQVDVIIEAARRGR